MYYLFIKCSFLGCAVNKTKSEHYNTSLLLLCIFYSSVTLTYISNNGSYGGFCKNVVKNLKLYLLQVKIVWSCVHWQKWKKKIGCFGHISDVSGIGHFGFRTFRNIFGCFGTFSDVTDSDVSVFGCLDLYSFLAPRNTMKAHWIIILPVHFIRSMETLPIRLLLIVSA